MRRRARREADREEAPPSVARSPAPRSHGGEARLFERDSRITAGERLSGVPLVDRTETAMAMLVSEVACELILERTCSPEHILSKGVSLSDCVLAAELDGKATLSEVTDRIVMPLEQATLGIVRLLVGGLIRAA